MKTYEKLFVSLMALVVASVTSCVNDELSEPLGSQILKELPTLEQQLASVEASAKDVKALQEALAEQDVELGGAVEAIDAHIAFLKGKTTMQEVAVATLDLQKQLARHIGAAEAELLASGQMTNSLMRQFLALEAGASIWLGEPFGCYYPVAVAEAKVNAVVAGFDPVIKKQKLYVDALTSDVEADLRKDENPEELTSLAASVKKTSAEAEELSSEITAKAAEMEEGYRTALQTVFSSPSEFDAAALKTLNSSVELQSVDNSLEGLISRVAACEAQLASVLERLGNLEIEIKDYEELLGMIQSVTFLSDFSSDYAVAYYNMNLNGTADSKGRKPRTPDSTFDLKYVVRPAAAASALTETSLRNDGLKILGYYASAMTKSADDMVDFTISNVTADAITGIVTVTVNNSLSTDFFMKDTGAKVALSLATGSTDLTSKFVEVVPKDKSGKVYVESLSLSTEYIEVDNGLTAQLRVSVTPENVTDATVTWTTSASDYVTVSENGVVTTKAVGEADVTVTTNSTDEWGNKISKTCKVKVLPSIKLIAPSYVDVGGTLTIRVDSPNYINPKYIKWSSSNTAYAVVNDEGVVTGMAMSYDTTDKEYDPVTITCTIEGASPVVLTHVIRVVAPQPDGVVIDGLDINAGQKRIKIGEPSSLAGSISPADAANYYRLQYQAQGGSNDAIAKIDFNTGAITANSIGSITFIAMIMDDEEKYLYPAGNEIWRYVTVHVDPYWVETMTLPTTYKMIPDATATLAPEWTTDVDGYNIPTDKTLLWESSDPSVVTVDANTGLMTAKAEGTATITATTAGENSRPEGEAHISSSCVVTVETPAVPYEIGYYYYSDGTWGTSAAPSGKSVIGVIFSKFDATSSDDRLRTAYPDVSHGLVLGVTQYSSVWGGHASQDNKPASSYYYFSNNGWTDAISPKDNDEHTVKGYTQTLALKGYRTYRTTTDPAIIDAAELVNVIPATDPTGGSPWYIPSYAEMNLIKEQIVTINTSLSNAGKATLSTTGDYWLSTLQRYNGLNSYNDLYVEPFNMGSGTWKNTNQSTVPSGSYTVLTVFAF